MSAATVQRQVAQYTDVRDSLFKLVDSVISDRVENHGWKQHDAAHFAIGYLVSLTADSIQKLPRKSREEFMIELARK